MGVGVGDGMGREMGWELEGDVDLKMGDGRWCGRWRREMEIGWEMEERGIKERGIEKGCKR